MKKLETYSTNREELGQMLARLADVVSTEESRRTLAEIAHNVSQNRFTLIVAGQFKRGKTTFINALLGSDLLPVAIIPVTSIITVIGYGDELGIELFFQDGGRREISQAELPHFITEKQNPQNRENVDRVEIHYPSPYLKNHVELIDTPGVASIHSHNTETTYGYLPKADAAIFLVSVDPPLTAAELHFLNDLRTYANRIFFVQNKIDTVSESDRVESLEFTRRAIEENLGLENFKIYPLSARNALEGKLAGDLDAVEASGLPAFERMLEEFLLTEKGNVIISSAVNKTRSVIDQEVFSLSLTQRALKEPLAELEKKISLFEEARQEIELERSDSESLVGQEARRLVDRLLLPDLDALKEEKTRALTLEINALARDTAELGNREFAETINEYLHDRVHDIFNEWRVAEQDRIEQELARIIRRLVERTNRIIERLTAVSSQIFGASLSGFSVSESLEGASSFSFKIDEDVKVALESITEAATLIMPRRLAHRRILSEARERTAKQIDRHCGRLRHDLTGQILETVEAFRRRLAAVVENTSSGIEEALDTGRRAQAKSAAELREFEEELNNRLAVLNQVSADLARLRHNLSGTA